MAKRPIKKREIVRHKASNYIEIYSNHAEFRITLVDFKIAFSTIVEGTPEKLEVESQVGVIMSPQQTKEFLRVLNENFEKYEKQYGPVSTPPKPTP